MPHPFIQRYLPTVDSIRENPTLRPLRHLLQDPELWHLHRRSVGGACFIGMFCAFIPLPGQMLIVAALAIAARCNLPIAVALVWVTNPVTFTPMFLFAYRLGAWLLDMEPVFNDITLSWEWLSASFAAFWGPLIVGCLVCGWVSGLTLMVIARVTWRFHILRRWQQRRERRRANASLRKGDGAEPEPAD